MLIVPTCKGLRNDVPILRMIGFKWSINLRYIFWSRNEDISQQ